MTILEPLTPTQLEILQAVWELGTGGGTASQIWQATDPTRELARTTVLTQLQRLHKKGWLRRRSRAGAVIYQATCDRREAEQQLAQRFVADFFQGSSAGLVQSLLGSGKVGKRELARLRAVLDAAEQRRSR